MSNQMPIRVDIVSDIVCPWCVIGFHQLAKASRETGIAIEVFWHPFELNPQMAAEGENLRDHLAAKYGTTAEASRQARQRLTALGAGLGFEFNYGDDMRMVNTFKAHQLVEWAQDSGKGHDANLALMAAFFTHRMDLNDEQVLTEIAAGIGLDREAAAQILAHGERADQVRQKEAFWTSRGISGVPAMIFQRQHLVTGAQGEENYARILEQLTTEAA